MSSPAFLPRLHTLSFSVHGSEGVRGNLRIRYPLFHYDSISDEHIIAGKTLSKWQYGKKMPPFPKNLDNHILSLCHRFLTAFQQAERPHLAGTANGTRPNRFFGGVRSAHLLRTAVLSKAADSAPFAASSSATPIPGSSLSLAEGTMLFQIGRCDENCVSFYCDVAAYYDRQRVAFFRFAEVWDVPSATLRSALDICPQRYRRFVKHCRQLHLSRPDPYCFYITAAPSFLFFAPLPDSKEAIRRNRPPLLEYEYPL